MSTELARSSFAELVEQAELLARSNLVPKGFRGKAADVVVASLLGRELGLGPMATMSYIDVIEGSATLNAEGKVALVRRAGHSISGEATATRAIATGRRRDTGDEMSVEWTLQMATRAGLAKKAVWVAYPEAMMWSRAVSQLCRMLFPDVLAGISYTAEEVESFTDTDTALSPVQPVRTLPAAEWHTATSTPTPAITTTRRRPPPAINADPDCGHLCCDTRTDQHHDHFLESAQCPACAALPPAALDEFDMVAFRHAIAAMAPELAEQCRAELAAEGWATAKAIAEADALEPAWAIVRSYQAMAKQTAVADEPA